MKAAAAQIAFRYRPQDSATGVTRTTTKRLADALGVDETQVIHLALHELATKFLPQYESDEGALTKAQLNQVKKSAPKAKGGTARGDSGSRLCVRTLVWYLPVLVRRYREDLFHATERPTIILSVYKI